MLRPATTAAAEGAELEEGLEGGRFAVLAPGSEGNAFSTTTLGGLVGRAEEVVDVDEIVEATTEAAVGF